MMKLGRIETKRNAIERGGSGYGGLHDGMRYMLDVCLVRNNKTHGEIRVVNEDGTLGSHWTDGRSWAHVRKVWKTLKENRDNSLN